VEASRKPRGRPGGGAAAARTEALFTEHGRTVAALCRVLLRDPAEAEDATQQTFLSAHRALAGGTKPREPAAWLATIARNECWSRIRARMREPLPVEVDAMSDGDDPLAEAIRRADLRALWRAVDELPQQQRDALLLREFGGLSYVELSAALAVSEPAVESLLFRARDTLRRKLRAAYASITGASWLDLLRIVVGGGPPIAAKVAALGVGAAAVGGTAAVVPRGFDNHRPSSAPVRTPAAVVVRRATPKARPVVTARVVQRAPAIVQRPSHAARRLEGERERHRGREHQEIRWREHDQRGRHDGRGRRSHGDDD
jgi:RNA polymerase sigma factor (sigma-70 family)